MDPNAHSTSAPIASSSHEERTIDRVIRLAFAGHRDRFEAFVAALRRVTPPGVEVILRGSAVTGSRWGDGAPFDADGPGTSDLDVTFIGAQMLEHWEAFYIPRMHTVPLSDAHPDACPAFAPLRRKLSRLARRPVNLQATTNLVQFARDVLFDQPYCTLLHKEETPEAP